MGTASYSEEDNIFPNRPHWLENGIDLVSARNVPPICWCPKDRSHAEEHLCQACRDIRLRHLIFCEAEGRMVNLDKLDIILRRTECDLCSLIALACRQILGDPDRHGRRLGTQSNCHITGLDIHKQQRKGYALTISIDWQWVEFEMVFRGKGSAANPIEKVLEVHPKVDMGFLKTMLEECDRDHPECRDEIRLGTPSQMCIIDLEKMNIELAPENCRYCALSYVWGKITETWLTLTRENAAQLAQKGSLIEAHLPRTIRDAMQLCQDLGERFLWVDSLCIIQNDPIFQKQQIDIMDEIYACASFTIIAAAGDNADAGLPGVGTWSRDAQRQIITIQDVEVSNAAPRLAATAERSVWNSRGWTYQERMFSQRAVFLTEVQAFFACSKGAQGELKNRLLPETYGQERFQTLSSRTPLMSTYTKSVDEYTSRSLTNEADILRAFLGVANDLSRRFALSFFYGLPSSNFEAALLWQPWKAAITRKVSGVALPSWSWASQKGGIKYTFKEHIITETTSKPIPAFWPDGEEPNFLNINWMLNTDGSGLIRIKDHTSVPSISQASLSLTTLELESHTPPDVAIQLALQEPGRLLFCTQCSLLSLKNSVPFVINDSWWTDYTIDVNTSCTSMVSIHSGRDNNEPIGFMEVDKKWAEIYLSPVGERHKWEFVALSVSAADTDDYMNRHFTMRRNFEFPLVWRRNVRELLVNVMLIQWKNEVATRLGVGKIYLDYWEREQPQTKWIVLE